MKSRGEGFKSMSSPQIPDPRGGSPGREMLPRVDSVLPEPIWGSGAVKSVLGTVGEV